MAAALAARVREMRQQESRINDTPPEALRPLSSLDAYRTQCLILAHAIRPEMAAMVAALAFGGGGGQ